MGRRKPAYTAYIDHSQSKAHIIHYVSVSTYRSNPLIALLQSKSDNPSLDGLDSASVGECGSKTRVTRECPTMDRPYE